MNYVNMIYNIYICILGTTITTHDFYNINEVVLQMKNRLSSCNHGNAIHRQGRKSECVLFMDIRTLN